MAKNTGLVERVARAVFEARHRGLTNCYGWDDSDLDREYPGARDDYFRDARAAIATVLKDMWENVSASMVQAAIDSPPDLSMEVIGRNMFAAMLTAYARENGIDIGATEKKHG